MPVGADWREFVRGKLGGVEFGKGVNGKPYVVGSEWRFNVSHSGEWMLVALARGCEVGVDIEQVRPVVHLDRIVERYSLDDADGFCAAWVRREALVKAAGVGLAGFAKWRELPAGWRLVDLTVPDGYRGALVIASSQVEDLG